MLYGRRNETLTTRASVEGEVGEVAIDSKGRILVRQSNDINGGSVDTAEARKTASVTNITLLPANASRIGATIYNDSSSILYLKLGPTASVTSFTCKMAAESYYEIPYNYGGIIDGLWATAIGAAQVTEFV